MAPSTDNPNPHRSEWAVLAIRYRWFLLRNLLLTLLLVGVVVALLPRRYTASVVVVPSETLETILGTEETSRTELNSLLAPRRSSASDILLEMARSREVVLPVLQTPVQAGRDTLPLFKALGYDSAERAYLHLGRFCRFDLTRSSVLKISVTTHWPEASAEAANAMASSLESVAQRKRRARAARARLFYEAELAKAESTLARVSERLAEFQSQHALFELQEQTRALMREWASLRSELERKRTQLRTLLRTMRPNNPVVARLETEIRELERTRTDLLEELASGLHSSDGGSQTGIPQLERKWRKLMSEVEAAQALWDMLATMYQRSTLEQARTTSVLEVLDPAMPPIEPSAPKPVRWLSVFGALSLLLSLVYLTIAERKRPAPLESSKANLLALLETEIGSDVERAKSLLRRARSHATRNSQSRKP